MHQLSMLTLIVIGQLPVPIQNSMTDWIKDHPVGDRAMARLFITKIRSALVEKGIPLDRGNRDFNRISTLNADTVKCVNPSGGSDQGWVENSMDPNTAGSKVLLSEVNAVYRRAYSSRRGWRDSRSRGAYTGRSTGCWICGDSQHFAKYCSNQRSRRCGAIRVIHYVFPSLRE